jgi:hypothetical protein
MPLLGPEAPLPLTKSAAATFCCRAARIGHSIRGTLRARQDSNQQPSDP